MKPLVIASSFALLLAAEMGDKSQFIAMTLACRYRALPVIIGVFSAFALLNLLAVAVGAALLRWIPQGLILVTAGGLFLVFAYRAWGDAAEADTAIDLAPAFARGALLASFSLILLAELGDKTQLAMIGLAASTGAPVAVFIGGTLGLWTVSLLGITIGARVLRRLPAHLPHRIAALLFLIFGLLALIQAVSGVMSVGG
ncbi:MAG: TMEM165/GDT1 family protein [Chromatiaceae bacterium]|nr:MAG: TMEM165/GDT1 family protein [Chromatiaceae bacterium]